MLVKMVEKKENSGENCGSWDRFGQNNVQRGWS
jgi:hypothetical protein